jgi:AraC-like DNA-binding protein
MPQVVSANWWETTELRRGDISEAWQCALSDCYLRWGIKQRVAATFGARIRQRGFDSLRLVQCECDPCSGERRRQQICLDPEPQLGIQIITKGSERFRFEGESVVVGTGDLVIWNSCQATEFEVLEQLHKSTVMIPLSLIEARLSPGSQIKGGVISTKSGVGALLYSQIRILTNNFSRFSEKETAAIKWSTVELAASAAAALDSTDSKLLSHFRLHQIQKFILDHLQEGDLTVQKIAQASGISVRYLHTLFLLLDCTVSKWILDKRLERCRDSLASQEKSRGVVKEVAFQWGFNDTAHFSRVFKQRFDLSPFEYWLRAHQEQYNLLSAANKKMADADAANGEAGPGKYDN